MSVTGTDASADGRDPPALRDVLLASRRAGFLGPGPVERHILHAEGFVTLARELGAEGSRLLDLGAGGGLPGLVIAARMPSAEVVLLEANQRRAEFLQWAVTTCKFGGRVSVVHQRAELCGRDPDYRGQFCGVVARSFGPPAVVAECTAPFLQLGGWLIVSEPPAELPPLSTAEGMDGAGGIGDHTQRWPPEPLGRLGLVVEQFVRGDFGFQILRQREVCPDEFPRRNGVPSKRPLF